MPHAAFHAGYELTDDPTRLDVDAVHAYLTRSYWAAGIPRDTVARALAGSLAVGLYAPDRTQIGLVRVITDSATFAYLCDVYVLEAHRSQGLAQAALRLLETHPRLQGLRRFLLVTQDAHALYAKFGYTPVAQPALHLEKRFPTVYGHGGVSSSR